MRQGTMYYSATKIEHSSPNMYGSKWRGPYLVTAVTTKEYVADVTHLKP